MTAVAEPALPLDRADLGERVGSLIGLERGQKQGAHARRVDDGPTIGERDEPGIARRMTPGSITVTDVPDRPRDPGQATGQRRLADTRLADQRGKPLRDVPPQRLDQRVVFC